MINKNKVKQEVTRWLEESDEWNGLKHDCKDELNSMQMDGRFNFNTLIDNICHTQENN